MIRVVRSSALRVAARKNRYSLTTASNVTINGSSLRYFATNCKTLTWPTKVATTWTTIRFSFCFYSPPACLTLTISTNILGPQHHFQLTDHLAYVECDTRSTSKKIFQPAVISY